MKSLKKTLAILGVAAALGAPLAVSATTWSDSTVAVGGYDLVSYHTGKKPLRGNGNHVAVRDGVTYLFANEANRQTFEAAPERYLPAYGGWCAYGVAVGKKFVGDPDVWKLVDGRLYLNLDTSIQAEWLKDVPGNIAKAESNWPRIRNRNPADL
jgi:YHS domain-containing protein